MDKTYIGGKEKNKHASKRTKGTQGRNTKIKTAIVGMRCREGNVVAQAVKSVNSDTINMIVDKHIKKGSVLCTNEAKIYSDIDDFSRLVVNHSVGEFVNGMASANSVESVWVLLKRGYYGTFHHFSKKHIDRYMNEFTFRLNGGNCRVDTIDRMVNLTVKTVGKRITYKELVA